MPDVVRSKRLWPALFVLGAASCLLVGVGAIVFRPARIVSYTAQAEYALRSHNIVAHSIRLGERWPDHINFQYGELVFPYGYQLLIRLADGSEVNGYVECAKLERNCNVSVAALGLRHVKVPDIEIARPWQLPAWLEPYHSMLKSFMKRSLL